MIAKSSLPPASGTPGDLDQSQDEYDELDPDSMAEQSQEEEIRILETGEPPSLLQRAYIARDNSNVFFIEEKSELTYKKKFILDDAEEVKKELEFRH